ncbi:MAG: hypothetical protein R2860_10475 [Desulfobacterales bacterium]
MTWKILENAFRLYRMGVPLARGGYSNKDYEYVMTGKRAFEDVIREAGQEN